MRSDEHGTNMCALWSQLIDGRLIVRSIHTNQESQELALSPVERQVTMKPVKPSDAQLLLRVLRGEQQKVVAADAARSISTVAATASRCLRTLGVECAARETPLAVVALAHAYATPRLPYLSHCAVDTNADVIVLTFPNPVLPLRVGLSHSQQEVVNLLLRGLSYRDIAGHRGTSVRTIANQLADAYTKLGGAGRLQVLGGLLSRVN